MDWSHDSWKAKVNLEDNSRWCSDFWFWHHRWWFIERISYNILRHLQKLKYAHCELLRLGKYCPNYVCGKMESFKKEKCTSGFVVHLLFGSQTAMLMVCSWFWTCLSPTSELREKIWHFWCNMWKCSEWIMNTYKLSKHPAILFLQPPVYLILHFPHYFCIIEAWTYSPA